ncbi:conserved hypothetical protein [Hyella patelloides LEGE 07179]|uniref:Cyclic phosphodiesterase-like protein n=1 Tax=Hyella patelloides LEGE 07179 TaxID=945734 RepID=A0A563VPY4_9CYAN|nr:hypothetical protein [Hyella patelloides]VEP13483.1 conserved hypothetical protein [Hyella patelloides LEGE 07179]
MNHETINNQKQFIIYACPIGDLNSQIEDYLNKTIELCGKNQAHNYMPHCTLTGFFTDELSSVSFYIKALNKAYTKAKNNNRTLDIEISKLTFNKNWHGLELQAEGLKKIITNFSQIEKSPTRQEKIRLKDWLHLSLAYGFNSEDAEKLKHLATEIIDIQASVNWELRFYQKNPNWTWNCLKSWSIV